MSNSTGAVVGLDGKEGCKRGEGAIGRLGSDG